VIITAAQPLLHEIMTLLRVIAAVTTKNAVNQLWYSIKTENNAPRLTVRHIRV
jgi:hypothetical protein